MRPQIIFIDSSTSSNQTIDLTNNSSDPTPHGTTDTSQSNQCQPDQNTSVYIRNITDSTQEADSKQLRAEKTLQLQMKPNTLKTQTKNKEATKETTPDHSKWRKYPAPQVHSSIKPLHPRLTQTQSQTSTRRTSLH